MAAVAMKFAGAVHVQTGRRTAYAGSTRMQSNAKLQDEKESPADRDRQPRYCRPAWMRCEGKATMAAGYDRLDLEPLLQFLYESRGIRLAGYRRQTISRRVQRRMQAVGVESLAGYIDYLQVEPGEFTNLMNALLIHVTSFFRDQEAWDAFREKGLPYTLAAKEPKDAIRVWAPGCSTGEEAYSVAMTLAEYLGTARFTDTVKIYATDVDERALDVARRASFPQKGVKELPEHLREEFFEPPHVSPKWKREMPRTFRRDMRRHIIFGRHDLMYDPPISKLDLLICRNTLIYMTPDVQELVLTGFHYALNPEGILFMGKAEMLLAHSDLFVPLDSKARLFVKVPKRPLHTISTATPVETNDRQRVSALALLRAGAMVVVVDRLMRPLFVNEQAQRQLGLSDSEWTPALFLNLKDAKRLQAAVQMAYKDQKATTINCDLQKADRAPGTVNLHIRPLVDVASVIGTVITLMDTTRQTELQSAIAKAQSDLERSHEALQATAEVLETTNEELQSTVEELETTNEELQSTNDELQATNAQMEALNADQQSLIEMLHELTSYHEAILTSLRIGLVVLDRDLRVKHWNKQSENYWGLRPNEVVGQPFLSLDIGLPVRELASTLRNVVDHEQMERLTLVGFDRRGRSLAYPVTCFPFATVPAPRLAQYL